MLLSYLSLLAPVTLGLGLIFFITFLASVKPPSFALLILLYLGTNSFLEMAFNFVLRFQFGAFSVYALDIFALAAILSKKSRDEKELQPLNSREYARIKFLVSAITLGVILGIITWTLIVGIEFGVSSWRQFLVTLSLMFYFLNKNYRWTVENLKVILILPGALLALVIAIRFVFVGVGSSSEINSLTGERYIDRATTAEGGLLVLLAGIGSFYLLKDRVFLRRVIMFTSVAEVILLQHRTVWISSLAFIIAILFSKSPRNNQQFLKLGYLFVLVIFGFLVWFIGRDVNALTESSQNSGTFKWRTKRWQDSLSITRSFMEWIFGAMFGPNRVTQNFQLTSHSEYVTKSEYLGIAGVVFTLLLFLTFFRYRGSKESLNDLQKIIVGSVFLYSFTYSTPTCFFILAPIIFKINLSSGLNAKKSFSNFNEVNHVTK